MRPDFRNERVFKSIAGKNRSNNKRLSAEYLAPGTANLKTLNFDDSKTSSFAGHAHFSNVRGKRKINLYGVPPLQPFTDRSPGGETSARRTARNQTSTPFNNDFINRSIADTTQ